MDKALRNTIIAGILIIALSVGYYLVIFIPKKEAERIEAEKKQQSIQEEKQKKDQLTAEEKSKSDELKQKQDKCLSRADEIKIKLEKDNNKFPLAYHAIFMDIFYSQSVDKCLYVFQESYMSPNAQAQIYTRVSDVLTDSYLASFKRNEEEEKYQNFISMLKKNFKP